MPVRVVAHVQVLARVLVLVLVRVPRTGSRAGTSTGTRTGTSTSTRTGTSTSTRTSTSTGASASTSTSTSASASTTFHVYTSALVSKPRELLGVPPRLFAPAAPAPQSLQSRGGVAELV